ncbi:MAG: CRTAC1 family protein [Planctomycetes bacterium]|nr:CRTAC1 family protein [Planctomycetota bacterium]
MPILMTVLGRFVSITCGMLTLVGAGCGESDNSPGPANVNQQSATPNPGGSSDTGEVWFVDIAEITGLHFVHTTGATGQYHFPEIAGSGCGLFDYDGDGDLDVYAVQAFSLGELSNADGVNADVLQRAEGSNRLYRNDLAVGPDGVVTQRFVDVTDESGLGDRGYGMGLAVGDYDNDGDLDLYVTNFGPNTLYRNNGDGTFTDVSNAAIPPEDRWSTSCAFVDYNRDGYVDLFVTNYVNFSLLENKICFSPGGRRDYCGPQSFDPVSDRLFANNGDGTFRDATVEAGINLAFGSGLGVVCADFNHDGWPDIYVANDGNANQLWLNQRDGTFENVALLAGAAYNASGMAEAGMGVTAGDFDLDGDPDIFLAHLSGEHNTLLVNDGTASFDDRTEQFALASMSWSYTGFGTEWADLNNDGYVDLFVANGAVKIVEQRVDEPYPYGNPNQLIINLGPPNFGFQDVSDRAGAVFELIETSRGAAFGDIDNDGDIDILVSNSNGPLRLLRNEIGSRNSWLSLRLVGNGSSRDAIGAEVRLIRPEGLDLVRRVHSDGSYCSANDLRTHFGLGDDRGPQTVVVAWPSGLTERFSGLPAMQQVDLHEGDGEARP